MSQRGLAAAVLIQLGSYAWCARPGPSPSPGPLSLAHPERGECVSPALPVHELEPVPVGCPVPQPPRHLQARKHKVDDDDVAGAVQLHTPGAMGGRGTGRSQRSGSQRRELRRRWYALSPDRRSPERLSCMPPKSSPAHLEEEESAEEGGVEHGVHEEAAGHHVRDVPCAGGPGASRLIAQPQPGVGRLPFHASACLPGRRAGRTLLRRLSAGAARPRSRPRRSPTFLRNCRKRSMMTCQMTGWMKRRKMVRPMPPTASLARAVISLRPGPGTSRPGSQPVSQ